VAGARAAYERAASLEPASVEALAGLVSLDLRAKNNASARRRVDAAVAQAGKNTSLLMASARTYAALGDSAQAEVLLKRVIEIDPQQMDAYVFLAQDYASKRRLDDAIAEYRQALARAPQSVGIATMIGLLLEAQGKTEDAQKQYKATLAVNPRAAVAANNLAWLTVRANGNLDEAMALAETARAA